jgi:streptogramin lyase
MAGRIGRARWVAHGLAVTASAASFVLPVGSASAAPVGAITEFTAGLHPLSGPVGIAAGPDGNVWVADENDRFIRVSPGGQMTDVSATTGYAPIGLAAGPDGNLWFTDLNTPAIGRLSPSGQVSRFSAGLDPAGSLIVQIAAGPDGNMWFTDEPYTGNPAAIGRITPSGQITEFTTGLGGSSSPWGIAAGPDGNIWFADADAIGRITPSGQITEFTTGLGGGSSPFEIAAGPDGNLWFTDVGTTKAIGRITPTGQIIEFSAGLIAGSAPNGIAAGPDGNLWFTDLGSTNAIGRITPSGQITEFSVALSASQSWIAPGPDGNLWFTVYGDTAPAAIGRIGAGTPAASQTAPVVAGSAQQGTQQVCEGDRWSDWAGEQPSVSAFGFDGYQWLLDGNVIAGQSARSYTPAAADIGHQLSCRVTVTYPLLAVTVPATSAGVTITPQVTGPPGAAGAAGATGPIGTAGPTGAIGATGPTPATPAGPRAGACVGRRLFWIHLGGKGRVARATLVHEGRVIRNLSRRGGASVRVDLRGLPRGRSTVVVTVRSPRGAQWKLVRHYVTCVPRSS